MRPPDPSPSPASPPPAPKLTKAPVLLQPWEPTYPPEAFEQGLSADVALLVDIDAEGNVTQVQVTRPAGHGFDEAATEAAGRLVFSPAEIDGKPAAIRIEYVFHFKPVTAVKPPPAEPPPEPESARAPAPPEAVQPPAAVIARGRLRERGTRDPIPGADVAISRDGAPATVIASTDEDGRFEVRGPPGGAARLIISDTEHEPCVRDVRIPDLGGAPVEIACSSPRRRGGVYETTVRARSEGQEVTRHTLSQAELTTVPGTFGDPLRVIQNLPGVARVPYGLGVLLVRGSAPEDTSILIDGHRVPLLYHFLGGPSILTADLIDKIDFYPGGFGVRYGRALTGVIDVTTRTQPVKQVHGAADVDLIDSSFYLEGPLGNGFSGGVAGRRSYIDLILPFVIPEQEGSTAAVVTPVYWDYQARVDKDLGRAGRLSLFAFGSDDSLRVIAQDPDQGAIDLGSHIALHRIIATWTVNVGPWTSRLSPAYGYDLATFQAGEIGGDAGAHVFGLREDLTRSITPSLKLAAGFDGEWRLDRLDARVPVPREGRTYGRTAAEITAVRRTLSDLATAVYVEALWDARKNVRIVPGLRLDHFHYNATDRFSLDPRVVVRWVENPRRAWKAGAGIFHQSALPWQLDPAFGNPNLGLFWADQYHAGLEQGFTDALSLNATGYYIRRHDLSVATDRSHREGDKLVFDRLANEGRGRSYGLELLLRHAVTRHFFGWISYTLSRAEENVTPVNSPRSSMVHPDRDTSYNPTAFDQTHNLIVVASYKLGGWELGTRFRLVTGVPETPIEGGIYDADFDGYTPLQGAFASTRRQTFHQLDLRFERTWVRESWMLGAYLDVQNVYNAENPEATIWDYRYRDSAPVRGLPILPTIGVRGRF